MLNELVLGSAGIGLSNIDDFKVVVTDTEQRKGLTENVRDMIVDEYLSSYLWDLPTSNEQIQVGKVMGNAALDDKAQLLSAEALNDNILTISLLVEGVGNIADEMTLSSGDVYLFTYSLNCILFFDHYIVFCWITSS